MLTNVWGCIPVNQTLFLGVGSPKSASNFATEVQSGRLKRNKIPEPCTINDITGFTKAEINASEAFGDGTGPLVVDSKAESTADTYVDAAHSAKPKSPKSLTPSHDIFKCEST